jgi:hypothetical protein
MWLFLGSPSNDSEMDEKCRGFGRSVFEAKLFVEDDLSAICNGWIAGRDRGDRILSWTVYL